MEKAQIAQALKEATNIIVAAEITEGLDPNQFDKARKNVKRVREEVKNKVADLRGRWVPNQLLDFTEKVLDGKPILSAAELAEVVCQFIEEKYLR